MQNKSQSLLCSFLISLFLFHASPLYAGEEKSFFQRTYERTVSYWKPILKKRIDRAAEYWGPRFAHQYHPALRRAYAEFYHAYGHDIAMYSSTVVRYWAPSVNREWRRVKRYTYRLSPDFWEDLERIPTPIKIAVEKLIFLSWDTLSTLPEEQKDSIPDQFRMALEYAIEMSQAVKAAPSEDIKLLRNRVAILLDQLRPLVSDRELAPCLKLHVIDDDLVNAFNTGCQVFISKGAIELLKTDARIRATLAHEVAHGQEGHFVKNFLMVTMTAGRTFGHLVADEVVWIFTDQMRATFSRFMAEDRSLAPQVFETYADGAGAVEIDADIEGARLLRRGGFPATDLKEALIVLHGFSPEDAIVDEGDQTDNFRNYPSLAKRLDAIDTVINAKVKSFSAVKKVGRD